MRTSHRYIALATLSAALASLIAYAGGQTARQQIEIVERNSPDLMPSADERRLSLTASKVTPAMSGAAKAGPTEEEVGDVQLDGSSRGGIDIFGALVHGPAASQIQYTDDIRLRYSSEAIGSVAVLGSTSGKYVQFNGWQEISRQ